jgi:hypothetical protein
VLSGHKQQEVQGYVAAMSPIDRASALKLWHRELEEIGARFKQLGHLSNRDAVVLDYAVEGICRIECIETGKGWFYRMRRRPALFRRYFKP